MRQLLTVQTFKIQTVAGLLVNRAAVMHACITDIEEKANC